MGFDCKPKTLPFPDAMPADTHATLPVPGLSPVSSKAIIARCDSGALPSDGGLLALRAVEKRFDIGQRLAACIGDPLFILAALSRNLHTGPRDA